MKRYRILVLLRFLNGASLCHSCDVCYQSMDGHGLVITWSVQRYFTYPWFIGRRWGALDIEGPVTLARVVVVV